MRQMQLHRRILVTIVFLLICISGFDGYGGEKKVLIVSQSSEFKSSIVASLQREMNESSIAFTIESVSALRNIREGEWDAIIILHAVKMGKINNHVKRYFETCGDFSKVIVLTTYGTKDPVPGRYGIDSISAASKKEQIESLTSALKNRLQDILTGES